MTMALSSNIIVMNISLILTLISFLHAGRNGWWFTTSDGPREYDPVEALVWASPDGVSNLLPIWWPGWRWGDTWKDQPQESLPPFTTPIQRGATRCIDMTPPWTADLGSGFYCVVLGWSLVLSVLVICRCQQYGPWVVVAVFVTVATLNFIQASAASVHSASDSDTGSDWGFFAGHAASALALVRSEANLRHVILGLGMTYLIVQLSAAVHTASQGNETGPAAGGLRASPPAMGVALVLLFIITRFVRWRRLRKAWTIVADDISKFDQIWERETAGEEKERQQDALDTEVFRLSRNLLPSRFPVLQLQSFPDEDELYTHHSGAATIWGQGRRQFFDLGLLGWNARESLTGRGVFPIRSLDTLYGDAGCASIILREKMRAWKGQASNEAEYGGSGVQESRAGIKSPDRAMDKALLHYGGDVSRLVDICRQVGFYALTVDITLMTVQILERSRNFAHSKRFYVCSTTINYEQANHQVNVRCDFYVYWLIGRLLFLRPSGVCTPS